jgi:NAD(P)-dependent dehydrogenase (short-subunit alcohol dehydrogenase family)
MGSLAGKVAVVTGAGQGVGRGIALALAGRGARVAVLGRSAPKLEESANIIVGRGGEAWDLANYGAYAAVKQATRSLMRAAAAEWGPDGIRVLTIAPHANSPGLNSWIETNPDEAEAFFRTIPRRRIGDCETDIGEAVAALCGPEFSYLTGAAIPLDGGQANFD